MDQHGAINGVRSAVKRGAFDRHVLQVLAPGVRNDACRYAPIPPPPSIV